MHLNELKKKISAALPEDHPLQKDVEEFQAEPHTELVHILEMIGDWKRGIRDWSEVQDVIDNIEIE